MADKLLLVGCGKMGQAMLAGWIARGFPAADIRVVEPAPAAIAFAASLGVAAVATADAIESGFRPTVVVLAVKPQSMTEAVAPLAPFAAARPVWLSIAAGKTIDDFRGFFGADAAIVRSMPNTPAAIGRGMMVACASAAVSAAERQLCDRLLAAVGEVAWVEDETLMDPVTAVSGSGPAYVFLLIEALAAAGEASGLPAELAMRLARQTVAGAAELAIRASEGPAQLRRNVTSPGGTTQAALEVLMAEGALPDLMRRAVAAATKRSRELAG